MRSPYWIVLNGLQSSVNIGRILRTCEVFQVGVAVNDIHGVLQDDEKRKTVSDFSCGALDRTEVADAAALTGGRLIATCVGQKAVELPDFRFQAGDRVYIGNEYDGLPPDVIDRADEKLFIPMPEVVVPKFCSFYPIDPDREEDVKQNGLANLSASTTASIIAYAMYLQARG